jgi:hypothetical protein
MAGIKIVGYGLSVAGLGIIALSNQIARLLGFLGDKALVYTIVGGVALITVGIALVLSEGSSSSRKIKQAAEEVPIYEGEGKKRKIVAYQKGEK